MKFGFISPDGVGTTNCRTQLELHNIFIKLYVVDTSAFFFPGKKREGAFSLII